MINSFNEIPDPLAKIYAKTYSLKRKLKSRDKVKQELIKEGISEEQADVIINTVSLNSHKNQKRAKVLFKTGAVVLVVGVLGFTASMIAHYGDFAIASSLLNIGIGSIFLIKGNIPPSF